MTGETFCIDFYTIARYEKISAMLKTLAPTGSERAIIFLCCFQIKRKKTRNPKTPGSRAVPLSLQGSRK